MPASPIGLTPINPGQSGWDVVAQNNANLINAYFKTWDLEVTVDGNTGTPSEVTIQLQDGQATPADVTKVARLKLRVVDTGGYGEATNATISAVTGGVILEGLAGDKTLTIETDANGTAVVELTDAVAETFELLIGPAEFGPEVGDHGNTASLNHS